MATAEAQRLKTLRRRRDYLVRRLEQDEGNPGSSHRQHLAAELGALSWALQELDEIRPELHAHTIKVVKMSVAAEMRRKGVDPAVISLMRDCCNRLTRRIGIETIDDIEDRLAEYDDVDD